METAIEELAVIREDANKGKTPRLKNFYPANCQIYVTETYDFFQIIKANRLIREGKVRSLAKKIEKCDLTHLEPILIGKKGQIYDGQHRFMACKALKKPVFFILSDRDLNTKEIAMLNAAQDKWDYSDYLHAFIKDDNENYKKFQLWIKENDLKIVTGIHLMGNSNSLKTFKFGEFVFDETAEVKEATKIFKDYTTLNSFLGTNKFISLCKKLAHKHLIGKYDHERAIQVVIKNPELLYVTGSVADLYRMMERIINYGKQAGSSNYVRLL